VFFIYFLCLRKHWPPDRPLLFLELCFFFSSHVVLAKLVLEEFLGTEYGAFRIVQATLFVFSMIIFSAGPTLFFISPFLLDCMPLCPSGSP